MSIFRCAPTVGVPDGVEGGKCGGEHLTFMSVRANRLDFRGIFGGTNRRGIKVVN